MSGSQKIFLHISNGKVSKIECCPELEIDLYLIDWDEDETGQPIQLKEEVAHEFIGQSGRSTKNKRYHINTTGSMLN